MSGAPTQTATAYAGHWGTSVSRIRLDWVTSITSDAAAANSSSGIASLQPRSTSVSPIASRAATNCRPGIGSPASNTVARWWNRPTIRHVKHSVPNNWGLAADWVERNGQARAARMAIPGKISHAGSRASSSRSMFPLSALSTDHLHKQILQRHPHTVDAIHAQQFLQFRTNFFGRLLENRVPTVE